MQWKIIAINNEFSIIVYSVDLAFKKTLFLNTKFKSSFELSFVNHYSYNSKFRVILINIIAYLINFISYAISTYFKVNYSIITSLF